MNIFEREQPEFVQMVLNVCFRGGDAALLRAIREVTLAQLGPVMTRSSFRACARAFFYTRQLGGIGRLLLMLAHDVEDEAARLLIAGEGKPESVVSVIDALNVYRDSVELLLNAPYGSVRLFDVDRVLKTCRALLPGLEAGRKKHETAFFSCFSS